MSETRGLLVPDPEAGHEPASEQPADEELEWSDDDEEFIGGGAEAPGGVAKPKKKDIGKWKDALAKVSQESIPEDRLHEVNWEEVALHFGLNLTVFAMFTGFTILAAVPIPVALVLFHVTFILGVCICEYLDSVTILARVVTFVTSIAIVVAGCYVIPPLLWLRSVATFLFVPLACIVAILRLLETSQKKQLHESSCVQALTGKRYIGLYEMSELVQLVKALYHDNEVTRRSAMSSTISRIGIGMVRVDDSNPDCPDVTLTVYPNQEISPEDYQLIGLARMSYSEASEDEIPIPLLEQVLKSRQKVSDRLCNDWVDDIIEDTSASASNMRSQYVVRKWFNKTKFPHEGDHYLMATLQRGDYFKGLWSHWAVRAVWVVSIATLLSMPAVYIFQKIDSTREELCGAEAPASLELYGTALCGAALKPCDMVCSSFVQFLSAMNSQVDISYVELLATFFLISVYVFVYSVGTAQETLHKKELIYLRRLREKKKATREVLSMKGMLEDIFSLPAVFKRFMNALTAWRGSDPLLTACSAITEAEFDLTAKTGVNDCFRQVMQPISSAQSSITCATSEVLPLGIGYPEGDDEMKSVATDAWKLLQFRYDLGPGRNYKILFDMSILSEGCWTFFKKWLKDGYGRQRAYLLQPENTEVQDSGCGSHLVEPATFFQIVVPKGFSLTHLYILACPEDGSPYQLEVGSQDEKEFEKALADLEKTLLVPTEYDEEIDADPDVAGFAPLDKRLYYFPIVARFTLSEQYFENMSIGDKDKFFKEGTTATSEFTEFVNVCMTPVQLKEIPELGSMTAVVMVFMGDQSPTGALISAFRALTGALAVYFQCFLLVMCIPLMRKCMQGAAIFPEPFAVPMLFNTVCVWYQFSNFFSEFYSCNIRLQYMRDCLAVLEDRTLAPSDAAAKAKAAAATATAATKDGAQPDPADVGGAQPADDEKATRAAAAKAKAENLAELETNPFDLFVMEDTKVVSNYDETDPFWKDQFRKKQENVRNWHRTVGYLRVFVSTSRLTAQAILVAAAIIVGFLMLASLMQAAQGKGALNGELAQQMLHAVKNAGSESMQLAAEQGSELAEAVKANVDDVVHTIANRRLTEMMAGASASVGAAVADGFQEPLSKSIRRLREALEPSRLALHAVLWRQHEIIVNAHSQINGQSLQTSPRRLNIDDPKAKEALEQAEAMEKKLKSLLNSVDVTKATKTQLFSLIMIVLVMAYSVPLIKSIVDVNGYFDRHEDLLIKQKENHGLNHARREAKAADSAAPAATSAASEAPASGSEKNSGEVARYEKVLLVAIDSCTKSRERFPLKLFGFVISTQLLGSWILLIAAPMASQAKQMAGPLSMAACQYVESSSWIDALQSKVDNAESKVETEISKVEEGISKVEAGIATFTKVNLRKLIQDNICTPLATMASQAAEKVELPPIPGSEPTGDEGDEPKDRLRRRLLARTVSGNYPEATATDLVPAVQAWWQATPHHHPEVKLAAVQMLFEEYSRESENLLVTVPTAAARSFNRPGAAGLWEALGTVAPHLEQAVRLEL